MTDEIIPSTTDPAGHFHAPRMHCDSCGANTAKDAGGLMFKVATWQDHIWEEWCLNCVRRWFVTGSESWVFVRSIEGADG